MTRPNTNLREDIDDLDLRFWSWRAAQRRGLEMTCRGSTGP